MKDGENNEKVINIQRFKIKGDLIEEELGSYRISCEA